MIARHDPIRARHAARGLMLSIACACLALRTSFASPAPVLVEGGYDHASGPGGLSSSSALVILGGRIGPKLTAMFGGMRYDDAAVGSGAGVLGGLAMGMMPRVRLRAWGSRCLGDQNFSAWGAKAGPEFTLPEGGTFGVFYAHDANSLGNDSHTGSVELAVPLAPTLTGRAHGSYAAAHRSVASLFGSLGLGWAPVRNLELTGDIGRARQDTTPDSAGGPSNGLPLVGRDQAPAGPTTSASNAKLPTGAVVQFGVRLRFQ